MTGEIIDTADRVDDEATARILIVDDEPEVLEFFSAVLATHYRTDTASDGAAALSCIDRHDYDAVLSDISMPGMDGMSLLRNIRERDLDLPVIMITGVPTLESAIQAVKHGALRYLTKPVRPADLRKIIAFALSIRGMAKAKRSAFELISDQIGLGADQAGMEAQLDSAIDKLWIAYQPIVSWAGKKSVGYEALLRTDEPTLGKPLIMLEAARKLGRTHALGRAIRARIARDANDVPEEARIFVNLLLADLDDNNLFSPHAPLSRFASRVVLEITEMEPIEEVENIGEKIAMLRSLGYHIAMDDLGAGHNGLSTFIELEPDSVKLDILLSRHVEKEPKKQHLIRSMRGICRELDVEFITEGVETAAQRDMLVQLGCDLFQGYLFGRPARRVEAARFNPAPGQGAEQAINDQT